MLSGVGFFPRVPGGVIPAKAGIQEISQKEQGRTLDARLRGHDGLEQSNRQKTRENCGQQEKPTLVRVATWGVRGVAIGGKATLH